MIHIYNKTFKTKKDALENVIAYIVTDEPELITDPELKALMVQTFNHGLTDKIIQDMEVNFYQDIWPFHNTDITAHRLAIDLAALSEGYADSYRPFCTNIA